MIAENKESQKRISRLNPIFLGFLNQKVNYFDTTRFELPMNMRSKHNYLKRTIHHPETSPKNPIISQQVSTSRIMIRKTFHQLRSLMSRTKNIKSLSISFLVQQRWYLKYFSNMISSISRTNLLLSLEIRMDDPFNGNEQNFFKALSLVMRVHVELVSLSLLCGRGMTNREMEIFSGALMNLKSLRKFHFAYPSEFKCDEKGIEIFSKSLATMTSLKDFELMIDGYDSRAQGAQENLHYASAIKELINLEILKLDMNKQMHKEDSAIPLFVSISKLSNLKCLILNSRSKMSSEDYKAFANSLENLKALEKLESNCPNGFKKIHNSFHKMPRLKSLLLKFEFESKEQEFCQFQAEVGQALQKIPALTELKISHFFSSGLAEIFSALSSMSGLKMLDLELDQNSFEHFKILVESSQNLKELANLSLNIRGFGKVDKVTAPIMSMLHNFPNLESFSLSCYVENSKSKTRTDSKTFPNLLECSKSLTKLKSFSVIFLGFCCEDKDIEDFPLALRNFKALEEVKIWFTDIKKLTYDILEKIVRSLAILENLVDIELIFEEDFKKIKNIYFLFDELFGSNKKLKRTKLEFRVNYKVFTKSIGEEMAKLEKKYELLEVRKKFDDDSY